MIGYLQGEVKERGENWLIVGVGGIGYKVFVTADTLLAAEVGKEAEFFCHHHFSQDAQALYGFPRRHDLDFFELLITVSGIGPKGAMGIISKAKTEEIEKAIAKGDTVLFSATTGVGKKKAEHIVLELKAKLAGRVGLAGETVADSRKVVAALEGLGYRRDEILSVLRDLPADLTSDADKVKWALKNLYR